MAFCNAQSASSLDAKHSSGLYLAGGQDDLLLSAYRRLLDGGFAQEFASVLDYLRGNRAFSWPTLLGRGGKETSYTRDTRQGRPDVFARYSRCETRDDALSSRTFAGFALAQMAESKSDKLKSWLMNITQYVCCQAVTPDAVV